jgi:hypothetical protein
MPHPAFLAVFALLLLYGGSGHAQGQWTDVRSPEGAFTVSMPCVPATWTNDVTTTGAGAPFTSRLGMCRSGSEIYLAGWVDYAPGYRPDIDDELKANEDNLNKGIGAVRLTSSPMTYQNFPGLDFTANRMGLSLVSGRVVMDGYRPVMWIVLTPLGEDHSANIRRFLTSMRVGRG